MPWLKLTRPDGSAVLIKSEHVVRIRPDRAGVSQCVLDLVNGEHQQVHQAFDQIEAVIEGIEGKPLPS